MARRARRPSPHFESLAFQVEPRKGVKADTRAARAILRRVFPNRAWIIVPLNRRTGEFEATPKAPGKGRLSVGAAWDVSYRLRQAPRIVYAEPLFEVSNSEQFARPAVRGRRARSAGGGGAAPGTEGNYQWSLDTLRVPQAGALFEARTPGAGLVVGHPDTG